ncbi:MAG TPA: hypothetical protein VG105_16190 [Paraburkholderia sp.]|nr:hypothetical protein [Paraburkholderia sp.]
MTFGACVRKSWLSTWQAIVQMPGLFLGAFAVFACITLLSGSFQHTPLQAAELDPVTRMGHAFIRIALSILQVVVYGCLTIKVHRFVLLGEGTHPLLPLGGKPLGRYALLSLGLTLAMMVLAVLMFLAVRQIRSAGIFVVAVPVFIAYLFAVARLSLLYPAIALGSRLALGAAWRDSRGHFWSIVGVWTVVYLPLMLAWLVFMILAGPAMLVTARSSTALAIGLALANAVFVVLAAAALSWLYRRYANELRERVGY